MSVISQRHDPSLRIIIIAVLVLHLFFIIWIEYVTHWQPVLAAPKKMAVHTVKLNPKPAPVVVETAPPKPKEVAKPPEPAPKPEPKPEPKAEEKPAPPPKPKPAPKKNVEKPKPVQKKSTPKPAPKPKKATPQKTVAKTTKEPPKVDVAKEALKKKQKELLSKAKDKMGKISTDKVIASASAISAATPSKIAALQIDSLTIDTPTPLSSQEVAYRDELASRLKLLLKLPENGEVKLKLTLDRAGKVHKVKILNSKSNDNRAYIEKTLPLQKMPPFGNNFGSAPEYTFTITLTSDW